MIYYQPKPHSLLHLYEQNYILFRLILPDLPKTSGWHILKSANRPPAYLHRISLHNYTSEWLLGHYFHHKKPQKFTPNHIIRIYHDARLCEALLDKHPPIKQMRQQKKISNQALHAWLDYLHRNRYQLSEYAQSDSIPNLL